MTFSRRKYNTPTSRHSSPCGISISIFETVSEIYPIQDFDGEPRDANAGRDYFKKRFARLAQKAGRSKEREIYIQFVTCNL
jgi:hypothetical protein